MAISFGTSCLTVREGGTDGPNIASPPFIKQAPITISHSHHSKKIQTRILTNSLTHSVSQSVSQSANQSINQSILINLSCNGFPLVFDITLNDKNSIQTIQV